MIMPGSGGVLNERPSSLKAMPVCEHKLPEALIVGVKKSGTFALLKYLSLNSAIRPALRTPQTPSAQLGLNEIHYFDRDVNWLRGIDWYKSQMPLVCPNDFQRVLVIEKTPGYFRSPVAPNRVMFCFLSIFFLFCLN